MEKKINIVMNQDNCFIGIDENGEVILKNGILIDEGSKDSSFWTIRFCIGKINLHYSMVVDWNGDYKDLFKKLLFNKIAYKINSVVNWPF